MTYATLTGAVKNWGEEMAKGSVRKKPEDAIRGVEPL